MNQNCGVSTFKAQSTGHPDRAPKKFRFETRDNEGTHNLDFKLGTLRIREPSFSKYTHYSSLNLISWNTQSLNWKQFQKALLQEASWPMDKNQWIHQTKHQAFVKKRVGNPLTTLVNKRLVCEGREDLETANSLPIIRAGNIHNVINQGKILNLQEYLFLCNTPKSFDVKCIEYNYVFKRNFSEELEIIKPLLFSKESKKFHSLIQHSRNLKPYKKEGSIMNCIKHEGQMIQEYQQVTHLCINKLLQIQGKQDIEFELKTPNQIFLYYSEEMLNQLKNNKKALSQDLTE